MSERSLIVQASSSGEGGEVTRWETRDGKVGHFATAMS
jgi:hypothetical protein